MNISNTKRHKNIILIGDFNARTGNLEGILENINEDDGEDLNTMHYLETTNAAIQIATQIKKETFLHLASQASEAVYSLHKQSRPVVGKLSPAIAFKVFDCQTLSILEYASMHIWYTGDSVNDLEKNTSKIY